MNELELLKSHLSEAETDYSHAIARGDWDSCSAAKAKITRLRNRVGKLIKAKMAMA